MFNFNTSSSQEELIEKEKRQLFIVLLFSYGFYVIVVEFFKSECNRVLKATPLKRLR